MNDDDKPTIALNEILSFIYKYHTCGPEFFTTLSPEEDMNFEKRCNCTACPLGIVLEKNCSSHNIYDVVKQKYRLNIMLEDMLEEELLNE
jgi:hypothetical protein